MRILDESSESLDLSRTQIKVSPDLYLPDSIQVSICFGKNNDPDAPYWAVKLLFHDYESAEGVEHEIVFHESPPRKPLEEFAISGKLLLQLMGDRQEDGFEEVVDLLVNNAYTPVARLEITKKDHWTDIWLVIGDWEAHYKEQLEYLEQTIGLKEAQKRDRSKTVA